jgi:hypothetical protein
MNDLLRAEREKLMWGFSFSVAPIQTQPLDLVKRKDPRKTAQNIQQG